jgi:hypothetical protein
MFWSGLKSIIHYLQTANCKLQTFSMFLIILALFPSSCDEDFDMNAEYQDISVIFGLLDAGEDTIFLKINKAFLGDGNVLEMAKIEDSSSYVNGLDATIEEWENGSFIKSYSLDTITIKNKEDGIFYNPYQVIYYTPYEPDMDRNYLLKVQVDDKTVTAETGLVNNFFINKPSAGSKFISFNPGTNGEIEWESAKNGKRYEILIRFKYKELLKDNPDTVYKYADWSMGTKKSADDDGGEEMKVSYSNDGFYSFLSNEIPYEDASEEENVKERFTNDVDVIIAVASTDLNTYMEVNEPSNSIIQERPEYTNISNGTGIFSSRFRNIRTKKLNPESIQDIKTLLPELKFVH